MDDDSLQIERISPSAARKVEFQSSPVEEVQKFTEVLAQELETIQGADLASLQANESQAVAAAMKEAEDSFKLMMDISKQLENAYRELNKS